MKLSKPFEFNYEIKRKARRNFKEVIEKLTLKVTGKGYFFPNESVLNPYERWTCDIESIEYNGVNIYEVMDYFGHLPEIEESALRYVAEMFNEPKAA